MGPKTKEKSKQLDRVLEVKMLESGLTCVVGVDEAGRGPLAGPVVAGACCIPLTTTIDGITDSKATTEEEREALFEVLTHHPDVYWGVGIREPEEIDKMNILAAALACMTDATNEALKKYLDKHGSSSKQLQDPHCGVLVDGNQVPKGLKADKRFQIQTVVKGDATEFIIAAGSIIAKVHRDKLMRDLDQLYPQYELAVHKGYPTPRHMQLVKQHGASLIHRKSFKPVLLSLPKAEREAMEQQLAQQKLEAQEKKAEEKRREQMAEETGGNVDIRMMFGATPKPKAKPKRKVEAKKIKEENDSSDGEAETGGRKGHDGKTKKVKKKADSETQSEEETNVKEEEDVDRKRSKAKAKQNAKRPKKS
eukprot:Platyproteum_vivax@DN6826_c0_g1_i1.p1